MSKLLVCLFLLAAACSGPSSAAREAQTLLDRGDFEGAAEAAARGVETRPRDGDLWRIRIRAAIRAGDHEAAFDNYARWRDIRGGDDRAALRMMALATLWQGLRVPSPDVRARAVAIVEDHEIDRLAPDVADLIAADSDLVAAAASVALLTSHPQAPDVATDLMRSADARARRIVTLGIGRKVGDHARDDVRAMFADEDASVRLAAVTAVAAFRSDEDSSWLATAATDKDPRVRARALRALSRKPHAPGLELARQAIADEYLGARLAGVAMLGRLGERGLSDLRTLAVGDDLPVALSACAALYQHTDEAAVDALRRAAESDDWTVRASALGHVRRAAPKELSLELAGRGLADDRLEVRLAAARVLLGFGLEERARTELEAALTAESLQPRLGAAMDLARRDHAGALAVIADLVRSEDAALRRAGIAAHRSIARLTPGLAHAFSDASLEVRLEAADVVLALEDDWN